MAATRARFAIALVSMAGAVTVHWLAYALAHPATDGRAEALRGHGYLGGLTALIVPSALAALCWLAVRAARTAISTATVSTATLSAAIAAVFVAQELFERAVGDAGGFAEPAIVIGLALCLPVAATLRALLRATAELVQALSGPRAWPDAPLGFRPLPARVARPRIDAEPARGRAPPRSLH